MKERKTVSIVKRVLINCASQAQEYGKCVAEKVPEVGHDTCLKEFLALKTCMQNSKQSLNLNKKFTIKCCS
ncbi:hypothetical protein LUZ63_018707 [Rhynchospora breviuscula]|uniref:IMS import disulfide relay-system CHCH-CHCH-like Cx9C domain-containing protein n=1 Tax=Rhynchospora breviuscula TaxID=2022672 RepID=A0A9Q0C4U3_9POAL|nr:hypothetical protein LUZ63_018707 [Rhynchospora breviuscula]